MFFTLQNVPLVGLCLRSAIIFFIETPGLMHIALQSASFGRTMFEVPLLSSFPFRVVRPVELRSYNLFIPFSNRTWGVEMPSL